MYKTVCLISSTTNIYFTFCFETRACFDLETHYVDQAGPELNGLPSTSSSGITGVYHHTPLLFNFNYNCSDLSKIYKCADFTTMWVYSIPLCSRCINIYLATFPVSRHLLAVLLLETLRQQIHLTLKVAARAHVGGAPRAAFAGIWTLNHRNSSFCISSRAAQPTLLLAHIPKWTAARHSLGFLLTPLRLFKFLFRKIRSRDLSKDKWEGGGTQLQGFYVLCTFWADSYRYKGSHDYCQLRYRQKVDNLEEWGE